MDGLDFSFSGLKTAILNLYNKEKNIRKSSKEDKKEDFLVTKVEPEEVNRVIEKADLCASFQKVATEMLMENVKKAIGKTDTKKVVLCRRRICKQLYQGRVC